jgi:hypothetical protein
MPFYMACCGFFQMDQPVSRVARRRGLIGVETLITFKVPNQTWGTRLDRAVLRHLKYSWPLRPHWLHCRWYRTGTGLIVSRKIRHNCRMNHVDLLNELRRRELPGGGWSFSGSAQMSLAATCLAAFSVLTEWPLATPKVVRPLLRAQMSDGSWPSFIGDGESSWTTALAICALNSANDSSGARERGQSWLLKTKGREGSWFWRWKFKLADRAVRFDPDRYGWPWLPGSASWVIPTAFGVIAIKQFTTCNRTEVSERRIRLGVEMLLDRTCVDGGWNSGNSLVYGVPLSPHVEATAIALLALQDERRTETIQRSLAWLRQQATVIKSGSSLAWCILSLFVYQEPVQHLKTALATIMGDGRDIRNNATLATALLALQCGEMIHPFEVLR